MLEKHDRSLRTMIMEHSLHLEKNLSIFLKIILGFDINSKSSSFDGSEALMLNNKINLLTDTNFINNESKNSLKCFMRIRNILMHNVDANTSTLCLDLIKGNFSRASLVKEYIKEKYENEEAESRAIIVGVCNKVSAIVHGMAERIEMYSVGKDVDSSYAEYGYAASLVNIGLRLEDKVDKTNVAEFNKLVHEQIEETKGVNQFFKDEITKEEGK
jgi:hypothetical protein